MRKEERDYLGGLSAQAGDRYARISIRRILNKRNTVIKAIHGRVEGDPIAETETSQQFEEFLTARGVDAREHKKMHRFTGTLGYEYAVHVSVSLEVLAIDPVLDEDKLVDLDYDSGCLSVESRQEKTHEEPSYSGSGIQPQTNANPCQVGA